jgi:hypothetical protein
MFENQFPGNPPFQRTFRVKLDCMYKVKFGFKSRWKRDQKAFRFDIMQKSELVAWLR